MAGGAELLRLLEPAVRPGGLQGPSRTPVAPLESRSFDSLLAEAAKDGGASSGTNGPDGLADNETKPHAASAASHLASLSGVDRIENAGVLEAIAGKASTSGGA